MSLLSLLISFVRRKTSASPPSPGEALRRSIAQRERALLRVASFLPHFRILLFVAGFAYLLLLPSSLLETAHQVSENALQPAQVNTYWNWADVHVADTYAKEMETWSGQSPVERVKSLQAAFESLGLPSATQSYSYRLGRSHQNLTGINVYSILSAPKTDGAEALVLSASWLSRALDENGQRRINVRGIALVLALANYLKKYAMWSKDVVFLVSDGYTEGTQAWLDSYHGHGHRNLGAEELSLATGPIWAALNLDYPHHSFSQVGMYFGANGHLPNLDLVNSASHILRHTGIPCLVAPALGTPSMIDDLRESRFASNSPLAWLDARAIKEYERNTVNLWRQLRNGATGRAGGPEGAFGKYRIDAMTLFGVPAEGPHGFHSFGRATESILRSLNNLLERLHAAAFLYFMTSTDSFITVGSYLAAPILVSAALTMLGLSLCMECFRTARASNGSIVVGEEGRIGLAASIVGGTHLLGAILYGIISAIDPMRPVPSLLLLGTTLILAFAPHLISLTTTTTMTARRRTMTSQLLRSTTLLLAGMIIAITSTLNFGLAVFIALLLFFPLYYSSRRDELWKSEVQNGLLVILNPVVGWQIWRARDIVAAESWMREVLMERTIGESWSMLIATVVVMPLLLQTAIANVL